MKRIFRIGSGLFIFSIVPIASWLLLAIILKDSRISNVFSITYAMQFVWAIFKHFFGSAANIDKEKTQNQNAVWNSIFWGTIFSFIVFSIPCIFVDNYISFFGQDPEFYRIYVLYSLVLLCLQTLLALIVEKMYFEDCEKKANLHLFLFNIINFVVLISLSLIIKTTWIALLITIIILFIYIIVLYSIEFEKFKINFSFFHNFKYESANIVSNIFMMLIYLFGFQTAFSMGEEYLLALNLVSLCTDAQWDSLGAIPTVVKVDISKNRFQYKKLLKQSYIFTSCIILSSATMLLALFSIFGVNLKIAIIYFFFQITDMILSVYSSIIKTYTQLEYSPVLSTTMELIGKCVRTPLSIFILSPFCTEIGQVTQGILLFLVYLTTRFAIYRIKENTLVVKSKDNNIDDKKINIK